MRYLLIALLALVIVGVFCCCIVGKWADNEIRRNWPKLPRG